MKKTLTYTILTAVVIFAAYWGLLAVDCNAFSYAVCFIIPVAGVAIGLAIGTAVKSGALKDNLLDQKKITRISIFTCCGLILVLTLFQYASCFVVETAYSYNFNNVFKGEHISGYTYYGVPINFWIFFKMQYIEPTYEIGSRYGSSSMDTGISGIGVIIYILQYVSAAFVALCVVKGLKDNKVCDTCKMYYTTKRLDRFRTENAADTMKEVVDCAEECRNYIPKSPKINKFNLQVDVCSCPGCKQGALVFSTPVRTGKQTVMKTLCVKDLESNQLLFYTRQ